MRLLCFEHMFGKPSVCRLRIQRWLAVSKKIAHLYQWFLNDIKQTTSFVRNATTRIIYVLCPRDLQSSPNYLCAIIVVWFFFFVCLFLVFYINSTQRNVACSIVSNTVSQLCRKKKWYMPRYCIQIIVHIILNW
jgi:hypothetical protein